MQASPRSPRVVIVTDPSAPIVISSSALSATRSPPPLGDDLDAAVLLLLLAGHLVALALEVLHHARIGVALGHAVGQRGAAARVLLARHEAGAARTRVDGHAHLRAGLVGHHQ